MPTSAKIIVSCDLILIVLKGIQVCYNIFKTYKLFLFFKGYLHVFIKGSSIYPLWICLALLWPRGSGVLTTFSDRGATSKIFWGCGFKDLRDHSKSTFAQICPFLNPPPPLFGFVRFASPSPENVRFHPYPFTTTLPP